MVGELVMLKSLYVQLGMLVIGCAGICWIGAAIDNSASLIGVK
jgi:hypothetical protein